VPSPTVIPALAIGSTTTPYGTDAPSSTLEPAALTPAGGSQPHTNLQPFLCVNFIISLFGIYPSQQ
jgi:microcystin-dependent protein